MSVYVYEYEVPFPYSASREDTFKALVDPAALQAWFAEHVEIEPKEGGAYRFWGKHSFGTAEKNLAFQRITKYAPPETLSFSWPLLSRDSEVTWTINATSATESKVKVRHEFSTLPEGARMKELIDDLWRLHTGNLCFFLKGDRKVYMPDFDDDSPVVRHVIEIDAEPAQVFSALTVPDLIKQWFPAPAPFSDNKVGGEYGFGFTFEKDGETVNAPSMTILEFVENEKLTITWPDWRGDKNVPDQRITWELEDLGGRTRLTLTHSGFTRTVDVSDYPFGWVEFIEKIKGVSESQ